MAGVSCGALVLFVGLPLAKSSPYPTPRDSGWVTTAAINAPVAPSYQLASASSVSFQLASASSIPVPSAASAPLAKTDRETPTPMEAQAAIEWEALTAPTITREMPAMMATIIPEPVWGPDPTDATQAADAQPAEITASFKLASIAPTAVTGPTAATAPAPAKRSTNPMDEVDDYLWEVYQREPVKKDSTGDFTWKDPAAAKKMGKAMPDYVIRGMDRDFREQLYHAGKAMDSAGIRWSMLSAFRDDYRQMIASGFKARAGNSLHGGSRAVGGYGHGRAADIVNADGNHDAVWRWVDRNGAKYGLRRPMPGADPAHIQAGGAWQNIAGAMRAQRTKLAEGGTPAKDGTPKSKVAKNAN
jgi:hypothetical protein